jgi:hypothetical protein
MKTAVSGTSDVPRNSDSTDAERRAAIKAKGLDALARIKASRTYDDWRDTGEALMVITEETLSALGIAEWNKGNKKLTKEFDRRFSAWELSGGSNQTELTKQERWALRELMTNPKYHEWYLTLDGTTRRRLNYPNAIIKKYNGKHPQAPRRKRPPSLKEQAAEIDGLRAHIAELEAARDDGDQFKVTDTAEDIAGQMVRRFTPTKAKQIAARMLNLLKERANV